MPSSFRRPCVGIVSSLLAMVTHGAFAADDATAPAPAIDPSVAARLDALDQQVQLMSRKLAAVQDESAAKAKDTATIKAGPDGFTIGNGDGSYSLRIGGYAQVGAKFFLTDDDRPTNNTLYINRARLIFDGVLGPYVGFRVMPDLAPGRALLADVYAQLKLSPQAVVQVGRFKEPFGLERLQSDAVMLFIERSLASQLTPDRDTGVQLGGILGGKVEYALGIFNGALDGASRDNDSNDDKEGVARVFATPFKDGGEAVRGIGIGIGGTIAQDEGTAAAPNITSFKSAGESIPGATDKIFVYRTGATPATAVVPDGWHWRVSPQAYWYAGPFGLLAEYVVSAQDVSIGGSRTRLVNSAWNGQIGWVLTGENASFTGVKVAHPFDPKAGTWGALEIGLRVSRLDVDSDAFPIYADPTKSVRSATAYGAALNWYLTRNLKLQTDYEITRFDGGAGAGVAVSDLQDEHVIESMLQVSF
ncbi:MAG: porin [Planctomycetes bacterium]|nr:porin [Planctomycetota bacterium]